MNLWRADNLSTKDRMAGPKVSFIQRFHCTHNQYYNHNYYILLQWCLHHVNILNHAWHILTLNHHDQLDDNDNLLTLVDPTNELMIYVWHVEQIVIIIVSWLTKSLKTLSLSIFWVAWDNGVDPYSSTRCSGSKAKLPPS